VPEHAARAASLSQDLADIESEARAAETRELRELRLEHEREAKDAAERVKEHRILETEHFEIEAELHTQSRLLAKSERRASTLKEEMQDGEDSMRFTEDGVTDAKYHATTVHGLLRSSMVALCK
jgi:hypothetical protein